MATGDIIKLGTLYCGGSKQPYPTKPWRPDSTPDGQSSAGNIYNNNNSTSTAITIGNTDSSDAYKLRWVEVNDGSDRLLICDRNLVVNITWDRLNALGYCGKKGSGKTITIDGAKYELFMLTGGTSSSDTSNQWDRYIGGLGNISGLPKPNSADLDTNLASADYTSANGALWHWAGCYSWCSETETSNGSDYRPLRGCLGARYWNYNYHHAYGDINGWRPALRVLNTAPVVSPSSKDYGDCKAAFQIAVTATDSDGDSMTGSILLDNSQIETFSGTANASHTIDLSKYWASLSLASHTIKVVVTDSNAAATTATYTFNKTNSSAAAPTISNLVTGLRQPAEFYTEIVTGTDAEKDAQTLKVQVSASSDFASVKEYTRAEIYDTSTNAWKSAETVTNDDAGKRIRIKVTGQTAGTEVYVRAVSTDAGSLTPSYSPAVKIKIGDILEVQTLPYDLDSQPTSISVFLQDTIDSKATTEMWVCNNAGDASPAWESYTPDSIHTFANKSKTSDKWSAAVKIRVTAGKAVDEISISAIGLGVI